MPFRGLPHNVVCLRWLLSDFLFGIVVVHRSKNSNFFVFKQRWMHNFYFFTFFTYEEIGGIGFGGHNINNVILLAEIEIEWQLLLNTANQKSIEYGLEIKLKRRSPWLSKTNDAIFYKLVKLKVNNQYLEQTRHCNYPGYHLTDDHWCVFEIKRRVRTDMTLVLKMRNQQCNPKSELSEQDI